MAGAQSMQPEVRRLHQVYRGIPVRAHPPRRAIGRCLVTRRVTRLAAPRALDLLHLTLNLRRGEVADVLGASWPCGLVGSALATEGIAQVRPAHRAETPGVAAGTRHPARRARADIAVGAP